MFHFKQLVDALEKGRGVARVAQVLVRDLAGVQPEHAQSSDEQGVLGSLSKPLII